MLNKNPDDFLEIKQLSFICKYKFNSKLSESTIRNYLYKDIKNKSLKSKYINGHHFIMWGDFLNLLNYDYLRLGFSYNPIIKK